MLIFSFWIFFSYFYFLYSEIFKKLEYKLARIAPFCDRFSTTFCFFFSIASFLDFSIDSCVS